MVLPDFSPSTLHCSFCGNSKDQVVTPVCGPSVYICNQCIQLAVEQAKLPEYRLSAPGYDKLADVLLRAFDQAARGKGKERHANDLPFEEQPMQTIGNMLHSDAFMVGQAIKKLQESGNLSHDAKIRERLGAIVYIAGSIIFEEKNRG